jgi:type I restriction enzyme R subunit
MDISERNFEDTIEAALLAYGPDSLTGDAETAQEPALAYGQSLPGGYHKRRPDEYDRTLCLVPRDVIDFMYATQPKEWEKLKIQHGKDVKEQFLKRLSREIARRGTLDVLRQGIRDNGCGSYWIPGSWT